MMTVFGVDFIATEIRSSPPKNILVEFEDGFRVVTYRFAVRRLKK